MSISTQRDTTRIGAATVVAVLIASLVAFTTPAGAAGHIVDDDRVAGANRYDTAAQVALATFEGPLDHILVASGQNFPDALAGNGLAGAVNAPILLTTTNALPPETATAITALSNAGTTVHILGGTAAVSAAVASQIAALGVEINRFDGADRYATAAGIGQFINTIATIPGLTQTKTVIVTTGEDFPDALAAGPLAFAGPHPVLLTQTAFLPASTINAINAIGADEVVILGGTNAVSAAAQTQLEALTGNPAIRVSGPTRYHTAAAVADVALTLGFTGTALLASGINFPDALAGGPHGGTIGAPIILTDNPLPTPSTQWLLDNCETISLIRALGGPAAITNAINATAIDAGNCIAPPPPPDPTPPVITAVSVVSGTRTAVVDWDQEVTLAGQVANYTLHGPPGCVAAPVAIAVGRAPAGPASTVTITSAAAGPAAPAPGTTLFLSVAAGTETGPAGGNPAQCFEFTVS